MIIEDGVALASLLVSATSERGHLSSAFHAGRDALQAAAEERFDLAIVDLLLPDLRGAEVLEKLRARNVPTIAMSGVFKGDRFAKDAVERHGARAFFEKPFDLARLLDTVDAELLRPSQANDAEQGDVADEEAIELDFDLEVDLPTAEVHLDHPTTELELHPEALHAFQEALADSSASTAASGQSADQGEGSSVEDDPEADFARMVDDVEARREAADTPEDPEAPFSDLSDEVGVTEIGAIHDDDAESTADLTDAVGDTDVETRSDEDAETTPDLTDEAGVDAPDAPPADDVETSFADLTDRVPSNLSESSSEEDDELSFTGLLDAPSPGAEEAVLFAEDDASDHIERSMEEAVRPADNTTAGQTPFSERTAVWQGDPTPKQGRSRPLPPQQGSLGDHGLFELLNACHQSGFSGTLHVEHGAQRVLTLVSGRLASVRDPAHPDPIPSIAEAGVREGLFSEDLLEEVRELAEHEGLSEDAAVVLMGLLTPDQMAERAQARLQPSFNELLGWTEGQLHLTAGASDGKAASMPTVPLAPLVFSGLMATADADRLAAELPDDTRLAPTEDPPYDLGEIPLDGPQAQLLAHSDGSKTIADLRLLSDLAPRDALATLWALVRLGILAPMHPTRSTRRITFGL